MSTIISAEDYKKAVEDYQPCGVYVTLDVAYRIRHGRKTISLNEKVSLNINSNNVIADVINIGENRLYVNQDIVTFALEKPIASCIGDRVAVSRVTENAVDLCGFGEVMGGKQCERNPRCPSFITCPDLSSLPTNDEKCIYLPNFKTGGWIRI